MEFNERIGGKMTDKLQHIFGNDKTDVSNTEGTMKEYCGFRIKRINFNRRKS